ncbi:hypothetical protein REPUB_Repub13aG0116700 [Reevesia pubescens]
MRSLVSFINDKNIHLVCDEIYAATIFSSPRFISIAEIIQDMDCNYDLIHISAIEKPGLAGIGGVLRDEMGVRLLVFSKAIGIADSNEAEFIAIKKAFSVFVSSPWSKVYGLIVDSDSQADVKWFNYNGTMPWKLKKFCPFIDSLKGAVISWQVHHIFRESNDIADGLAKACVFRT